jgi:ADP-ribosylglycohydrolase
MLICDHIEKFKPASWTDDTDHALLIILSYLHHDGVLEPIDLAKRLRVWCNEGLLCLGTPAADIGITIGEGSFLPPPPPLQRHSVVLGPTQIAPCPHEANTFSWFVLLKSDRFEREISRESLSSSLSSMDPIWL